MYIQLVITSVWKVQFQHLKHFSVANNDLFHMVHLIEKYFSNQILQFLALVP